MDRITAIRKSLTVFAFGLAGLVPLVGIIPALYAIHCRERVRAGYVNQWNPAAHYLKWGPVFALLGLLGSFVALATIYGVASGSLDLRRLVGQLFDTNDGVVW
jgi:hypothetical protein